MSIDLHSAVKGGEIMGPLMNIKISTHKNQDSHDDEGANERKEGVIGPASKRRESRGQ